MVSGCSWTLRCEGALQGHAAQVEHYYSMLPISPGSLSTALFSWLL